MALATLNFESQYLNGNTTVSIILPDKTRDVTPQSFYGSGNKYPVLWLLHGTFGDHSDWVRKSMIELYAREQDLVVVMPSALNSDYSNWDDCMMGYAHVRLSHRRTHAPHLQLVACIGSPRGQLHRRPLHGGWRHAQICPVPSGQVCRRRGTFLFGARL